MKVACIQPAARSITEYRAAFDDMYSLTSEAADKGADFIVQPEAAYPAYFLGLAPEAMETALSRSEAYLAAMAALAATRKVHIVACAAIREGGRLYNAAVLFDDAGRECARTYKACLWHFDRHWFHPGTEHHAFDTRFGRMGMMICADGRVPEIARLLALDGARVIVEPANLVATARSPELLVNPQTDYLLPVRALENRVWILVANKVGLEAGTVSHSGRSMIIDPRGAVVAGLPPHAPGILYGEIDPHAAQGPPSSRRPAQYAPLARDPLPPPEDAPPPGYATVVRFAAGTRERYLHHCDQYCRAARLMGTSLLVLPPPDFPGPAAELAEAVRPLLGDNMIATLAGEADGVSAAALFDRNTILGLFRSSHGEGSVADGPPVPVETPEGTVSLLFGDEGYLPEMPRIAMLLGAEIAIWYDTGPRPMATALLRARAVENRIFVIRTGPSGENDAAAIAGPEGTVLATSFLGAEQAVGAALFLPLARSKHIVPGTTVDSGRNPICSARLADESYASQTHA